MNIYTFPKDAIKKLATKQTLSIYPILIGVLIAVYFIINHYERDEANIIIMIGVGLFMLIGGFFSSRKAITKVLSETEFILDDDVIIKHIPNGKDIEIFFRDIRIQQHTKKGVLIKTRKKQLLIPIELTNFKGLEAIIKNKTFTGIQYFDTKYKMNNLLLKNLVALATLFLLVATLILESKTQKLLAGIPLILVFMIAIYTELKNKGKSSLSNKILARGAMMILSLIVYLIYIAMYF